MNVLEQPVSAGIFPIDYGDRLRIGVILPSGNTSVEPELTAMAPPGVRFFFTRAALTGSTERELMGMAEGAGAAAKLLADARVDRIVFHCTGVTMFSPGIGEKIRSDIESLTGIPTFVTSDAIIAALNALQARRIALLTPYVEWVHEREKAFLKGRNIDVVLDKALGLNTNTEMVALAPAFLAQYVRDNTTAAADAYFLSCTALRSAGIIAELEAELKRPVITSNQAAVWYALASVGVQGEPAAFGRLLACPIPMQKRIEITYEHHAGVPEV
jgi:maleate cis-trans isomerase